MPLEPEPTQQDEPKEPTHSSGAPSARSQSIRVGFRMTRLVHGLVELFFRDFAFRWFTITFVICVLFTPIYPWLGYGAFASGLFVFYTGVNGIVGPDTVEAWGFFIAVMGGVYLLLDYIAGLLG